MWPVEPPTYRILARVLRETKQTDIDNVRIAQSCPIKPLNKKFWTRVVSASQKPHARAKSFRKLGSFGDVRIERIISMHSNIEGSGIHARRGVVSHGRLGQALHHWREEASLEENDLPIVLI